MIVRCQDQWCIGRCVLCRVAAQERRQSAVRVLFAGVAALVALAVWWLS